jgi:hypothetical protein
MTIDGDRKSGVYGAYWNVVITPDGDLPPVRATLSEKVWAKAALPLPDTTTSVRVTARRNASGRWNVTDAEAALKKLKAITATIIQLERAVPTAESKNGRPFTESKDQEADIAAYRFRLQPPGAEAFHTRVLSRALDHLGIRSLPLGHPVISDWTRESWGWKLNRIDDVSLRAFFQASDASDNELPTASGHLEADWRFDDGVKDLVVNFDTDIADVSLRCRLLAHTLRSAGLRLLAASDTVTARLSLREGRWRFAELVEPRPDLSAAGGKDILYAVDTRLAFQEVNSFGELVNWLDIQDKRLGIGVASLAHTRLIDIDEGAITPGAHIVCDLIRGKSGWYASRIHRIADQTMVFAPHVPVEGR